MRLEAYEEPNREEPGNSTCFSLFHKFHLRCILLRCSRRFEPSRRTKLWAPRWSLHVRKVTATSGLEERPAKIRATLTQRPGPQPRERIKRRREYRPDEISGRERVELCPK